jgi:hypothetical protein
MNQKLIVALVSSFLMGRTFSEAALTGENFFDECRRRIGDRPGATPIERSLESLHIIGVCLRETLYGSDREASHGEGYFSQKNINKCLGNLERCIGKCDYSALKSEWENLKKTITILKSILNTYKREMNNLFEYYAFGDNRDRSSYEFSYFNREVKREKALGDERKKKALVDELGKGLWGKFFSWNRFENEGHFEVGVEQFFGLVKNELYQLGISFPLLEDADLLDCYLGDVETLAFCLGQLVSFEARDLMGENENLSLSELRKRKYELIKKIGKSYRQIEVQIKLLSRFKFFDDLLEISVKE